MPVASPFAGPWMGGFEGADHVNAAGVALDLVRASGHLERLEADHRRAAEAGLACVRETIGWRHAEAADGTIDLSRALRVARSARHHGLQVLWTLMHYGVPDGVCLHDDALVARFERFAIEVARTLGAWSDAAPVYTPVNEIGFLAWMAAQPGHLHPPNALPQSDAESSLVSGYAVKRRLARAAIAAVHAMRRVDPRARFMHVEPVVHVVAPPHAPDDAQRAAWQARAEEVSGWQWQAFDLLAGRDEPGFGGSADVLDIVGVNHYHSSQWELLTERRLPWHLRDARRVPMATLLDNAWRRYGRSVVVAETGHVGVGRAAWLNEMASEVRCARRRGVPVEGLCLYPLTDRPDWQDPRRWHRSGLWHVADGDGSLERVPEHEVINALRAWRHASPRPQGQDGRAPLLVMLSRHRWGAAQQRLQPLAMRLAQHGTVVFVEPPRPDRHALRPGWRLDRQPQGPQLDVLVPCHAGDEAEAQAETATDARADSASRWPASPRLQALLNEALQAHAGDSALGTVWLDDPQALPLARSLSPRGWVWDIPGPPPAVLAGAVLHLSERLCGVDRARHAASRSVPPGWAEDEARRLLQAIGRPRLVCLDRLDVDIDRGLLHALARARPAWHVVLIGPHGDAAEPAEPDPPGLYRLGEQPPALVPALMAACDVALLPLGPVDRSCGAPRWPLALLDSLAAGLPIVASRAFGPDGADAEPLRAAGLVCTEGTVGFEHACEAALAELPQAAQRRHAARCAWLAPHDWDAVAAALHARLMRLSSNDQPADPPTGG